MCNRCKHTFYRRLFWARLFGLAWPSFLPCGACLYVLYREAREQ